MYVLMYIFMIEFINPEKLGTEVVGSSKNSVIKATGFYA